MAKGVFISKDKEETLELKALSKVLNFDLISKSFLRFKPVKFDSQQTAEVIFFGSPRAVEFYIKKTIIPSDSKIASVGSKTTQVIESMGYSVDFEGKASDPNPIAKEFKLWCGDRTVLFPLSNISLGSIAAHFEVEQKTEIVVYETIIESTKIVPCKVYVFTSPSNLRGFMKSNTLPKDAFIISWGSSTTKALRDENIHVDHELSISSIEQLAAFLKTIF